MTTRNFDPAVSFGVAFSAALVLAGVSAALGWEQAATPSAQYVFVGSIVSALTVAAVRPALRTRAGRGRPDRGHGFLIESAASGGSREAFSAIAAAVSRATRAAGAVVEGGSVSVTTGITDGVAQCSVDVKHQGQIVAKIGVFASKEPNATVRELLEQLAISLGPTMARIVLVDRLEARVVQVEDTVARIEANRRAIVEAEYEGRRLIADRAVELVEPVLIRMRTAAESGDLDGLARECDHLVELLRTFSRSLQEATR